MPLFEVFIRLSSRSLYASLQGLYMPLFEGIIRHSLRTLLGFISDSSVLPALQFACELALGGGAIHVLTILVIHV